MIQGCEWTLTFFSHNFNLLLKTSKLLLVIIFHKNIIAESFTYSHANLKMRNTVYSGGRKFPYYFQEGIFTQKIYSPKISIFTVGWVYHNGTRYGYNHNSSTHCCLRAWTSGNCTNGRWSYIVHVSVVVRYEQWKSLALVMWLKCATVKCCI